LSEKGVDTKPLIRAGTAPVSWGVMEVEGWTGNRPYTAVLDEMVQAGYSGTELGPYGFLPSEPVALNRELDSRGLTLVAAFVPLPLARPEAFESGFGEALKVMDLIAAGRAKVVVFADEMSDRRMAIAGRAEKSDGLTDRQWRQALTLLSRSALAARERGLRATFHHHAGTYVETPHEIDRLLELTDPGLLGLCLDTGHYYYGGGDPVDVVKKHSARIWHLHWKDVDRNVLGAVRSEKIGYLDAVRRGVFCELGSGAVDLVGVKRELTERGYNGWSIFEQDVDASQPGLKPVESAARSREYLRRVLGI
jgi:inosose dehydratase